MEPNQPEGQAEERLTDEELSEREARIAELEAKLARPPKVGVMPLVAATALAGTLALMWMQWDAVSYYFSPREPIQLGSEGAYQLELLTPNRYVELHGEPTAHAAYWQEADGPYLAVGVLGTPIVVRRRTLDSEKWTPGTTPPRPDPRAFTVAGRLLTRAQAGKYAGAFEKHDGWQEVNAKWMLMAEARPGTDYGAMGMFAFLMAFGGVNLWLLMRGVVAWVSARGPKKG